MMPSGDATLKTVHLAYDGDGEVDDAEIKRMSRLSIESPDDGGDADAELTSDEEARAVDAKGRRRQGTRRRERWLARAWQMKKDRCGGNGTCSSSSSSAGAGAGTGASDEHVDRCRVLVKRRGPDSGSICMDLDEVKACRELGIELPCEWTVEIPGAFSGIETSSGGNSPIGISGPGDDPRDVKARLKAWAQAVALASASSLSG